MKNKPLTKSRFKLGLECPNKLFFTSKKEYANTKVEDTFLKALAQGGFQVEELARLGYPQGVFVDVDHHQYDEALQFTKDHLTELDVILFEAGFGYENLFVRTDIVEKKGDNVRLIEVKAKSFNSTDEYTFLGKKGGLVASWKPYLYDLAFQKYVAQKQYPDYDFTAFLCLADKTKIATIDGLNQMFRVPINGDPRKDIVKKLSSIEEIGGTVLSEVNVDEIINDIIADKFQYLESLTFEEIVDLFSNTYRKNEFLNWPINYSSCKNCEFKANEEQKKRGLLSGFEKCFSHQLGWKSTDFEKPNAFEVWNFQGKGLVEENRLLMEQLTQDDFKIKPEAGKISTSERRWIQVEKAIASDTSIHIETEALKEEMNTWVFPLHFIDFETSAVALPFTKGMLPYEQIAFQFSEHLYFEDGRIEHHSEYINSTPGSFPNFYFVRALKKTLKNDNGSIFRFADHENTILCAIISQLEKSDEFDKTELIDFLKTITHSTKTNTNVWKGNRDMIDLRKIILDYYYNPLMKGSNSIKFVLPAIINSSLFLQNKYSKPIFEIDVSSKNFSSDHIWLQPDKFGFINPYKSLPSLFQDWTSEELDKLISEMDLIADGGAALTAYAKLQYIDMPDRERKELLRGLLKYCELDTLAMVMIYEHLKNDF